MANRIIVSLGASFLFHLVWLFILAGLDGAMGTDLSHTSWAEKLPVIAFFLFMFFVVMRPREKSPTNT